MIEVIRTSRHGGEKYLLTLEAAVTELASEVPAGEFPSRLDILAQLNRGDEILTLNWAYKVSRDYREAVHHVPA
jgi:hypothetical protein